MSNEINSRLNKKQQLELLNIARRTVESYLRQGKAPEFKIDDQRLKRKEGAFVTLRQSGQLRGCVGQLASSDTPLWQVVRNMARAAASEDHRFEQVSESELEEIDYEISVLSAPERISSWQDIELGRHGVIVKKGLCSGVFLPQVAHETGWTKEEFLAQLCSEKAGLPLDCYKNDPEVELMIFTAQVFFHKTNS